MSTSGSDITPSHTGTAIVTIPRITISYCTQCRWLLRAAYFAQELLTTFSTAIGEIALQPTTGGVFQVHLVHVPPQATSKEPQTVLLWDRKAEGGFPETKVLKQRVRDYVEPDKNLGHSDKPGQKGKVSEKAVSGTTGKPEAGATGKVNDDCEDCK